MNFANLASKVGEILTGSTHYGANSVHGTGSKSKASITVAQHQQHLAQRGLTPSKQKQLQGNLFASQNAAA